MKTVSGVNTVRLRGSLVMFDSDAEEATSVADVFRDASDGLFIIDRNRKVTLFSAGCEKITGLSAVAAVGSACACHEITDCKDVQGRPLDGVLCPAIQILEGTVTSTRQRMSVSHPTGKRTWVETSYSPLRGDMGTVVGVVGVMRDISELVQREAGLPVATEPQALTADEAPTTNMGPLDRRLTTIERHEILTALDRADGQRTLAAKNLGISRSRLYRRMEALGIYREGAPTSNRSHTAMDSVAPIDR